MIRALLVREYRSFPSTYWALWLGTLINKAGSFVVPFLALYVTASGGSSAEAGLIVSLYGGGAILAGITGGLLADRVGRRAAILLSLFGGAAALLAMGQSRSLSAMGTSAFFTGWLIELYRPAVSAAVADLVPPADRERAYAYLYWVINVGMAIASPLAGLVASVDYFALFAVNAATLVFYGVIVLWHVPETRPAAPSLPSSGHRSADGPWAVFADRPFVHFLLLSLGLGLVMWQTGTALPIDMKRHGVSEASYGLLMAINGGMIVVLQPLLTPHLTRLPRTGVLAVAALLVGAGFGLYGVFDHQAGYALAIAIWTLGEIAILPTSSAVVADLAPAALRGSYQGLYAVSWGIGLCIGPLVGGALLEWAGGRTLWLGCFLVMLVVTIGHVMVGAARSRREVAARGGACDE